MTQDSPRIFQPSNLSYFLTKIFNTFNMSKKIIPELLSQQLKFYFFVKILFKILILFFHPPWEFFSNWILSARLINWIFLKRDMPHNLQKATTRRWKSSRLSFGYGKRASNRFHFALTIASLKRSKEKKNKTKIFSSWGH